MKQPSRLTVLIFLVILMWATACQRDAEDEATPPATAQQDSVGTETIIVPSSTPLASSTQESTVTATATTVPTLTPTATPVPTGPLTVCMGSEPPSLYLYGPDTFAARAVREVIYDGPIDTRGFSYQAIILEKIPSLVDGDARLETVSVTEDDLVVDSDGNVVRLRDGVTVRPAGCRSGDCIVRFVSETASEAGASEEDAIPAAIGSVEMDQLAVDFTLLPDLTWSDGVPLTAADSVFSYEVAQDAELPPRQRTGKQGVVPARRVDPLPRTASYESLDEGSVRWTGLPGYLDPYYQGNFFTPLPSHLLADIDAAELQEADASARLPLGWGPYVLTEWEPGVKIVAERNPNYFKATTEGPVPYFDQIIFRFAQDDPNLFLEDVASGECDVVTQDALNPDWEAYLDREDAGELTVHATPGTVWEHLDFGINPVAQYTVRGDYFEDPRMRQAIAYCVDRQAIMGTLMAGRSVVPDAYIPPQHPLYEQADLTHYAYDPGAGINLLQQVGWRDTNGDGVSEAYGVAGVEEGARLVFDFVTSASALRQTIATMVAEDLATCGMRVNVSPEPVPPQTFFAADPSSPIFGRVFDMTSFAWFSDALPPCHLYLSSQTPTASNGWSGFNVAGYVSDAYDAACNSAQERIPGMEGYADAHIEALRIFNQDLPAVPLFVHLVGALSAPDIQGLAVDATQPTEMWNVEGFRRAAP